MTRSTEESLGDLSSIKGSIWEAMKFDIRIELSKEESWEPRIEMGN